jgi:hypothetical protein
MPKDATHLDADSDQVTRSSNGKYLGKTRLLTRAQLDKRTSAAQQFDAIARAIATDLGGEDHLSTVQKHLVEAFAGCAVHVGHINALLMLGKEINILEHSNAISTMVRVASRIGVNRIAKDVSVPRIDDYVKHANEQDVAA